MWLVAHATCGAALSKKIRNRWLLAAAAIASHVVLDMIPHWDYPPIYAVVDVIATVYLVARFFPTFPLAWWGAFWAAAPDIEVALSFYNIVTPVFPSHQPWFPHDSAPFTWGSLLQVGAIYFFLKVDSERKKY